MMNAATGRSMDELDHIRQSVTDILFTPVGSRLMRREYGSLLPDLIDAPLNAATRLRLISATYSALLRWEPRIRPRRVQLVAGVAAPHVLTLELTAVRTTGVMAGESIRLIIESPRA